MGLELPQEVATDLKGGFARNPAPRLGVALIGIIFAVERRRRHPRVSLVVSLGLLGIIAGKAGGIWLQMWIRGVAQSGHGMAGMSTHVAVVGNALNALSTAALALVAVAVFLDRGETQKGREGVKRIAE